MVRLEIWLGWRFGWIEDLVRVDWAKLGSTNDLVRMEIWLSWAGLKIWLGLVIWLYQRFGWVADLVGKEFCLVWTLGWVIHLLVLKFGWAGL